MTNVRCLLRAGALAATGSARRRIPSKASRQSSQFRSPRNILDAVQRAYRAGDSPRQRLGTISFDHVAGIDCVVRCRPGPALGRPVWNAKARQRGVRECQLQLARLHYGRRAGRAVVRLTRGPPPSRKASCDSARPGRTGPVLICSPRGK
jgi:hypothetical protein